MARIAVRLNPAPQEADLRKHEVYLRGENSPYTYEKSLMYIASKMAYIYDKEGELQASIPISMIKRIITSK